MSIERLERPRPHQFELRYLYGGETHRQRLVRRFSEGARPGFALTARTAYWFSVVFAVAFSFVIHAQQPSAPLRPVDNYVFGPSGEMPDDFFLRPAERGFLGQMTGELAREKANSWEARIVETPRR